MEQEVNNVETVEEEKVTAEPTTEQPEKVDDKKYSDAEVDEIINKKYAKWKKDQEAEQNEAKKLKSMNAEEKTKYNQDKRQAELDKREQEISKRELMAEAKNILNERGLPIELANVIDLTDANTVKSSIDGIGKQWEQAVQRGIADKLKGSQPITKASQAEETISQKEFHKMSIPERVELKTTNPELYNQLTKKRG